MSKVYTAFALFATSFFLATFAFGQADFVKVPVAEGFDRKPPAYRFQEAWLNTFHIRHHNVKDKAKIQDTGTVSVVKRLEKDGLVYVGFLTAKHVLASFKDRNIQIYREVDLDTKNNILDYEEADTFRDAEQLWIDPSKTHDLSFFVLRMTPSRARGISPLRLSPICQLNTRDPLVSIGFPYVPDRAAKYRRQEIEEPDTVTKRWSQGFYVGDLEQDPDGPVVGTTLDAMGGSSGGPVLDASANLAGIVSSSVEAGARYFGREETQKLESHAYIVECAATKTFVEKSWKRFLATIPPSI